MKTILYMFILSVFYLSAFGQTGTDLNINHLLRASMYATSSIVDTTAPGGFGRSDNMPKRINDSIRFTETGFFLKIDTTQIITIGEKYNGYRFYIVNKSDSLITLKASDSRLYVIAQAFIDGTWQPIEYLPSSWCGNSFHQVFLKQKEYWEFQVPKFDGAISTRIRYRLWVSGRYMYSNEVAAKINRKQLTDKQEYTPGGIMDPYND